MGSETGSLLTVPSTGEFAANQFAASLARWGRVIDPASGRDEPADFAFGHGKITQIARDLTLEEPVGILEWLASRCPLRVQRRHKFSVGRVDGTPVRVRSAL